MIVYLITIDKLSIVMYIICMDKIDKKVTNFGKWCRKLRIDKGWSMTDVAEKLGYGQNHIM